MSRRPISLLLHSVRVRELIEAEQRRLRPNSLKLMRLKHLLLVIRARLHALTLAPAVRRGHAGSPVMAGAR